jgi:NAD(P)-dependent dehydrogenase (short-subunit alcohol dehydrogenase family)
VTGGASGIGFAPGQAFADARMKVMLADIEMDELTAAVERRRESWHDMRGIVCDVADPASVERTSRETCEAFGKVHVACDNAGVAGGSGSDTISVDTRRWVIDVNLMGVVHGIHSFLPRIRAHGKGGHIVNTASMAGLNSGMGFSPYSANKFTMVNMSEGLAARLKPHGIGVTVVCPGFVHTRISESGRNRQERYGPARTPDPASPAGRMAAEIGESVRSGTDPSRMAAAVLTAIHEGELFVFPHPRMRDEVEERFAAMLAARDKADISQ